MNEPYEFYEAGADYVRTRMPFAPQIAVILGSSLGPFAERLQNTVEIDYHEVPNFPVSTAPGHAGKLMERSSCASRDAFTATRATTSSS